jgi:uncharacterized protein involved in propanediol utilization
VDTLGFKRMPYTAEERRVIEGAYGLALDGLRAGDLDAVARAATVSARLNQRRQCKPHLEELIRIAARRGGYGVCVAHSGTVTALLFDELDFERAFLAGQEAVARFDDVSVSYLHGRSRAEARMLIGEASGRDAA